MLTEYKKKLFTFLDETPDPQRNGDHFLGLLCAALWVGLGEVLVKWSDATIKGFHSDVDKELSDFLGHIEDQGGDVGFEWEGKNEFEIADQLAHDSPKLRMLARMVGEVGVLLDQKMLAWVQYPVEVVLVTKFLMAIGIDTLAYHAQLSVPERDEVIRAFNNKGSKA